ncbi:MAG: agglutinin biogenesis protein MshI [Betaproteobacteria bacterium]|nr:agglutinin biogenesis protein MshI [Betaproteobacteria bacterium]
MRWRGRSEVQPGWAVVDADGGEFALVRGDYDGDGRPRLLECALRACDPDGGGLARAAKDFALAKQRCLTLLKPDEYQLLVVEAPKLPREEWKSAARWLVKEMLDYDVDTAAFEVLDIPPLPGAHVRAHQIFAVAARNDVLAAYINRYSDAKLPLAVIDIPETAQRNLCALHEPGQRAAGLAYFDDDGGLFTVTHGGELYMSRRIETGMRDLLADGAPQRAEALDRILLEVQRSLDHFERQYNEIPIARIVLGPEPRDTGLAAHLAKNLAPPVSVMDLAAVVGLPDGGIDPALQWRLFHLIGAALRATPPNH